MNPSTRIYLAGFMGAGKSSAGPRVSRILEWGFLDLDDRVSEYLGMSIPAIFDVLGEEAFREAEAVQLARTIHRSKLVVSLGGGALMPPVNLSLCLEHGQLVYLRASVDFLVERLENAARTRPLLSDDSGEALTGSALRAQISVLLQKRKEIYERAHHVVDVDGKSSDEVAQEVAAIVRGGAFAGP